MALELNVSKNTNEAIAGTYGKYYSCVEYKGTMDGPRTGHGDTGEWDGIARYLRHAERVGALLK